MPCRAVVVNILEKFNRRNFFVALRLWFLSTLLSLLGWGNILNLKLGNFLLGLRLSHSLVVGLPTDVSVYDIQSPTILLDSQQAIISTG